MTNASKQKNPEKRANQSIRKILGWRNFLVSASSSDRDFGPVIVFGAALPMPTYKMSRKTH
jgi:hypothetical protein